MKRSKGIGTLCFLLLVGLLFGGFVGDFLAKYVHAFSYQQMIGMNSPISIDLNFIKVSFLLAFRFNLGTVIGLIIAIFSYYKVK
ncbi:MULTISPECIES: DUF4321 domain-containing protein [Thermoanaerobacterium]|uniref:DUF4321 domain-containing protein n=1 Tax=Thermoanaerobacterium xylanolyticum (strain ATCC 49914 / DSM 7097 / LX-11) TaxID=858215 RepID=F6BHD7_THEXL|nr:DUF4321 domain-containing protein [Thermoanaerobacterium xylanolyticum]AEF17610.1 hypothetical protein Thexy_1579 [Thermoanaerobacterium xylanolyticum LX-11]